MICSLASPSDIQKRYYTVNMLTRFISSLFRPAREPLARYSLALMCAQTFGYALTTLLWEKNDSFDHDFALFAAIIFGPPAIGLLLAICFEFKNIPVLADQLKSREFHAKSIRITAFALILELTGFLYPLSDIALRQFGLPRWSKLGFLVMYLFVVSGLFFFLWRENKRLYPDPA